MVIPYQLKKKGFGSYAVLYRCPHCQSPLTSPGEEAGTTQPCPDCNNAFAVPGKAELDQLHGELKAEQRAAAEANRQLELEMAQQKLIAREAWKKKLRWLVGNDFTSATIVSFLQRRWRAVALIAVAIPLLYWIVSSRPYSDPYTFVNAGDGKVYKVNRRTGESWLLVGNREIPVNQQMQLTPEQELARQQSQIEADAATKKKELETAARIKEAETERTRLQQEFARQEYARAQAQKVEEQKRMQQQQARLQQEREQKLAADQKKRAIDLAQRSVTLGDVLPDPANPRHSIYYSRPLQNRNTIDYILEFEKDPNLQIEGWAAEMVAGDVYLVSYTYTTGTGSSKVRTGYYFEVNVNKEIVQNIFRDTERFNKYQQYGINPNPSPSATGRRVI